MPLELQGKLVSGEGELKEELTEEELPKVNISGVIWGIKTPIAFIDGKVYKIGDIVGDAKIVDIDKNGVRFLYNGREGVVKIKK